MTEDTEVAAGETCNQIGPHTAVDETLNDRPVTAPAALRQEDAGTDIARKAPQGECDPASALDAVTEQAVAIFREGRQQDALDMAVQFAMTARERLGRTHPVSINALATVAALVDQMGGDAAADALLLEAEDLQDEMEMEALGIDLYADDDDGSEGTATQEPSTRPPTDEPSTRPSTSLSNGGRDSREQGRRPSRRSSSAVAGESECYSDDDDWLAMSSSDGESGSDGDVEPISDDNASCHSEEAAELEAEAITRLTWEVNTQLKNDNPEEAARLLSEAENILAADGNDVSGMGKAALHTLWAAVLNSVGEDEKAQSLYDEAIHILRDEFRPEQSDACTTSDGGGASNDEDEEDQEEEEEEEEQKDSESSSSESEDADEANDQVVKHTEDGADPAGGDSTLEDVQFPLPASLAEALAEEEKKSHVEASVDEEQPAAAAEAKPCRLASNFTATDILIAKERAARIRAEMSSQPKATGDETRVRTAGNLQQAPETDAAVSKQGSDASSSKEAPGGSEANAAQSTDNPSTSSAAAATATGGYAAESQLSAENPSSSSNAATAAATATNPTDVKVAQPPPGASPKRRRPPPLAPQPATQSAPKASVKPPARTGGGFSGLVRPPAKPKVGGPKHRAKAKAKPSTPDVAEEADDAPADPPASEEPQVEVTAEAEESPDPVEVEPAGPLTAEQQLESIQTAMRCADHFLGLMKFERAADKLEEQLVQLGEESSPHRHTDLHVEVLLRYGGVLWWDGDPEGAIDAFTAAEEIIIDKPQDNAQKKRRTELWMQSAQVCRGCGDYDSADEQLSQAVRILSELTKSEAANSEYRDCLKEAQAALAQVCVHKKDFERAEELYLEAFGGPHEEEAAAESDKSQGADASSPAEPGKGVSLDEMS